MSITPGEINEIAATQELFLPTSSTVRKKVWDGDEYTYELISADEPCRLATGLGSWRNVADRWQGIDAHVITFRRGLDIHAGDQVLIGTKVYEVRDVHGPASYLTALQVLTDLVD